jgi:dihydrofolate reductase
MGTLVVGTFVTLDGVMQGPGGPDEDRDGGFEHGGWSVNYWDEVMVQEIDGSMQRAEALLLGRRTYEIFAAHWPHVGEDDPVSAKLNNAPKYVATRTLSSADWKNTTLLKDDVARQVAELKERVGGEIQVSGSSNLIQTLLEHDVVDEFRIWVFPLVLGTGKRLFDQGTVPAGLKHVDTKVSSTGVAIHTYQRAGNIEYGSFGLEQ